MKRSFQHLLTRFFQVCINDKSWLGFTPVCLLKIYLRVNFVIFKWETLGGGHSFLLLPSRVSQMKKKSSSKNLIRGVEILGAQDIGKKASGKKFYALNIN